MPVKPSRKYVRSRSPRAVERRRLQNRVAQRNHRQRIKESIEVASSIDKRDEAHRIQHPEPTVTSEPPLDKPEDVNTTTAKLDDNAGLGANANATPDDLSFIDPQLYQIARAASPSGTVLTDTSFQAANPQMTQHQPQRLHWLGDDPTVSINLLPVSDSDIASSTPASFFANPNCTCNSITGPCSNHLTQLRSQMFSGVYPIQPLMSDAQHGRNQQLPPPSSDAHPSPDLARTSQSTRLDQYSSSSSPPSLSSQSSATRSTRTNTFPSTRASSTSSITRRKVSSSTSSSPSFNHSPIPAPPTGTAASESDMTSRLRIVLDAVRTAGFADFDKMAVAYYTARFEKRSVPDLAQCASRGRRLKTVIQDLVKGSEDWSRWESRGLQDSTVEATKALCVAELECLEVRQAFDHMPVDPPDFMSALAGGGVSSSSDREMSDVRQQRNDKVANGDDTGDTGFNAGGPMRESFISALSDIDRMNDAVQDSIPHLWSLLTELAGPQSLYCDRIAQLLLAILIDARRTKGDPLR
ncbi:hypothetical protein F4778DRAFT_779832 [Xylariomycetidae sp. FL2044]|nr:hypothetical protein F4778DRAFT_779832 [Xylariomycetidae sp. FL2044]